MAENLFRNREVLVKGESSNPPSEGSRSRGQGSDQEKATWGNKVSPGHEIGWAGSGTSTETIEAHREFIARRRATRPSEEYRTPTDEEWDSCLAHFEKRKVSVGTCARACGSSCVHEHRAGTRAGQRLRPCSTS